jgi:RNA polymerase sigma-70 factor (ECF subfamily)
MLKPMPPLPESPADAELIQEARDGSDDALRQLVNRYLPSVYTFCMRYMGNSDDAQDAAQETFLKAWRNLGRFDTKKSFKTWLFAIAKNTATDIMRKRKSVVFSKFDNDDDSNVLTDTLTDTEPLPEELFDRALAAGEVQTALQTLKPRDRMLLSLRYDEELSFEDIAKIMKISANTIRSLHRRALMSLRAVLEQK